MPSGAKILIIEDDPGLGRGLTISLETEAFEPRWARDLKSARAALADDDFQLILLDLNLPDGNGISFLERFRAQKKETPVIILTARADEDSTVNGLHAGANDYVKKPFSQRELVARIRTALRDAQKQEPLTQYDGLTAQPDRRKIFYRNRELELNRREFDVLYYLITHAETVVTRNALLSCIDKDGEIFDRTIDSHVSHVRSRLKKAGVNSVQISSVYGVGYRLDKTQ